MECSPILSISYPSSPKFLNLLIYLHQNHPLDLVSQTWGKHHQYPDGFMLFLGTMFSPIKDRDAPGGGFTHHLGDRVTISAPPLGALVNTVRLSTEIAPWTFGVRALYANLAERSLLNPS